MTSPPLPLLQSDGLQYDRKAFPVAINKSGKPHRHIVVRRLVRSTPAPLGAKLILNWRTIGDGIDFLLQQLHEHSPEQAPDLCVGVNGFGLALAGFLAGAYSKGRTRVVQARNDPSFHDPVIEAESLPDPSEVNNILVVDSEMKSGVATRNVVDWLCEKYRDDTDIKIAILAACRVQGKISAINDLWKQGQVLEDDPKYLPDYLSFISENLIEPPVKIR